MKASLERWLLRRWYGKVAPGLGLRLLAMVYGLVLLVRDWLYRRGLRRVHRLGVPVIVVGNLVVGGTGKTPLTIALAKAMAAQGWRPGVVSRGYGRRSQDPVRVTPECPPEVCGDEPLLIARQTGLPVQVDSDRVAAARQLIAEGCNLILADDGLQHRRLGRDIEIEVIDSQRRHGNGRLLPAGPLRERLGRKVDFRVVNDRRTEPGEWPMILRLDEAWPLEGGVTRRLTQFASQRLHAVAGIGHPERFFAALRANGLELIEHEFPDHHVYVADDLEFSPPAPILMTEKDAVKCLEFAPPQSWAVPVHAELPTRLLAALRERLADWSSAHGQP